MRNECLILIKMSGRRHVRNLVGFLENNHKIFVWKQGVKLAGRSALNWQPFVNVVMNFRVP